MRGSYKDSLAGTIGIMSGSSMRVPLRGFYTGKESMKGRGLRAYDEMCRVYDLRLRSSGGVEVSVFGFTVLASGFKTPPSPRASRGAGSSSRPSTSASKLPPSFFKP